MRGHPIRQAATRRRRHLGECRPSTDCRRTPSSSPPARSRTPCWRARTRRTSRSTANTSAPATRTGAPVKPERAQLPSRNGRRAAVALRRWPLHQLLRRPASVVLRQRGQGHGLGATGLPGGVAGAGQAAAAIRRRPRPRSSPAWQATCSPRVHKVERLTPTIVEVVVRAPLAARKFQPGQFYRLQNFETLSPREGRRHAPADGRPRADRRLGRPRARAWSRPSCWKWAAPPTCAPCCEPGEPVILMGPTGTPTHIAAGETVILAGGGLGNAVLFSIGQAFRAKGSKVLYFAGYKKVDRPLQGRRHRGRGRRGRLVLRRGSPASRPAGRRTAPSSATSCRRWTPMPRGGWARRAIRTEDADRIIAIGSDRMMAGRGPRAPRRAQGPSEAASLRHRLDQLADAVHDEGDLRPVPAAAARPAHRQGDATCSPASTRTSRWTASTSALLASA